MNRILIYAGLFGSVLMYAGDLLLYFSTEECNKNSGVDRLYEIMSKLPKYRIRFGALLGVFAAFLGAIGGFHIYELVNEKYQLLGLITSLLWMFAFIAGGVFHSHWYYFRLIDEINGRSFEEIERNVELLKKIAYTGFALATGLLFFMILFHVINLPLFMLFLTPGFLFILLPLLEKLSQPYYLLIVGGWGNLPFIIYYLALIVIVRVT